jgi:hypothetical protein
MPGRRYGKVLRHTFHETEQSSDEMAHAITVRRPFPPAYPPAAEDVKLGERDVANEASGARAVFDMSSGRQRRRWTDACFAQIRQRFDDATHDITSSRKASPETGAFRMRRYPGADRRTDINPPLGSRARKRNDYVTCHRTPSVRLS